jgi:hypothetical protein
LRAGAAPGGQAGGWPGQVARVGWAAAIGRDRLRAVVAPGGWS